jgi:acyl carrier protein|tara:strand:- start:845 stop:1087 length:243 start_codon:yes stop_codon:yes gene_type:complete
MEKLIEERMREVISAVFNIPVNEIRTDASSDNIESWDSLKHMNMVSALEEEFLIEFDDKEIFELLNYELIKTIVLEKIEN